MKLRSNNNSMKRPSKNVVMFLFSLTLGVIGVFFSKRYIEDEITAYKASLEKSEEMVEVVVPARKLNRGELVAQADLTLREIPIQYIDSNSITGSTFEAAVGQRVEFAIDRGKPMLWAHLEGGQTPTFSGKVPTGLRAMTIRVDEVNSLSGFLQPKDKIDLLLTYGDRDEKQILPLIQNLNVIATGVQTFVDKQNSGKRAFSTITIQASPEQAKKITLSQQFGTITAMLRNPDDESQLNEQPMTIAQVLNLPEPLLSKPMKATPKRVVAKKPLKPQIQYIIGGS